MHKTRSTYPVEFHRQIVDLVRAGLDPTDLARQFELNRSGFPGGSNARKDGAMRKHSTLFSPEIRERAVRMVFDHQGEHGSQYAAIRSIVSKIGCSGGTPSNWIRQAERDRGQRAGPTTKGRERIKALGRKDRELRQANEIVRKASAYFVIAELDRRWRT